MRNGAHERARNASEGRAEFAADFAIVGAILSP